MAIIKCKMCGGDLNIVEDSSVCECCVHECVFVCT